MFRQTDRKKDRQTQTDIQTATEKTNLVLHIFGAKYACGPALMHAWVVNLVDSYGGRNPKTHSLSSSQRLFVRKTIALNE